MSNEVYVHDRGTMNVKRVIAIVVIALLATFVVGPMLDQAQSQEAVVVDLNNPPPTPPHTPIVTQAERDMVERASTWCDAYVQEIHKRLDKTNLDPEDMNRLFIADRDNCVYDPTAFKQENPLS